MKTIHACFAFLLLAGCMEPMEVSVNCETNKEGGVDCEAKQVKGKGEAKACWDFTVECEGDVKVEAPNTCVTLKGGGSEKATIPAKDLKNADKCTKSTGAKVSKLTINGEETTGRRFDSTDERYCLPPAAFFLAPPPGREERAGLRPPFSSPSAFSPASPRLALSACMRSMI